MILRRLDQTRVDQRMKLALKSKINTAVGKAYTSVVQAKIFTQMDIRNKLGSGWKSTLHKVCKFHQMSMMIQMMKRSTKRMKIILKG